MNPEVSKITIEEVEAAARYRWGLAAIINVNEQALDNDQRDAAYERWWDVRNALERTSKEVNLLAVQFSFEKLFTAAKAAVTSADAVQLSNLVDALSETEVLWKTLADRVEYKAKFKELHRMVSQKNKRYQVLVPNTGGGPETHLLAFSADSLRELSQLIEFRGFDPDDDEDNEDNEFAYLLVP